MTHCHWQCRVPAVLPLRSHGTPSHDTADTHTHTHTHASLQANYRRNMYRQFFGVQTEPELPSDIDSYFDQQHAWVRAAAAKGAASGDAWWVRVQALVAQADGLLAGYNAVAPATDQFKLNDMLAIGCDGDLETIQPWLKRQADPSDPDWDRFGDGQESMAHYRCSSLVRLAPDLSTMWMGHDTWDAYSSALRVFKHYSLYVAGTRSEVSFSSSPAMLTSVDDCEYC